MTGLVSVPDVGIEFVEAKAGEIFKLGPITCRVLEDGSHTGQDNVDTNGKRTDIRFP